MSVGTGSAHVGSIGWDGRPGFRGAGRAWMGFIAGLIVLALIAVAPVALTPTASRVAGGAEPAATGPVPTPQGLSHPQPGSPGSDGLSQASRERALDAYGKLPLSFVPNAGQTDRRVRYYAQGSGFGFFFTRQKAVLAFEKSKRGQALELRFPGSSATARLEASGRAPGRVNYLTAGGSHTNLPTYHQLVYRGLWPGIDMVFRGRGGSLKYEFHLAPGADPSDIRLAYRGADGLALGRAGALLISTPLGSLRDSRPRSYQRIGGTEVAVPSRFSLEHDAKSGGYGFGLGDYDDAHPLVIDPGLAYSTYLGGTGFDQAIGVAVDSTGAAYVTGPTESANFPTTLGAFDTTVNGSFDAFVTKLNPAGSGLVYSTYLGGSGGEGDIVVAVDSAGAAYVTGATQSADFPTTAGAFDTTFNGGARDAFVTKLNPLGSGPAYSTYLGGSGGDGGLGVAVDSLGAAYVTGSTDSANYPTTAGAFDTTFNGSSDAFVTKLNPAGSSPLLYSTYLGGTGPDAGHGVAVDSAGAAYVTGATQSGDFPTTAGAFDTTFNGGQEDAFVTKLNPAGSSPLLYSTYLGGSGPDQGFGVAVDSAGAAYVTGQTGSANFPTTAGAFDTTFNGVFDAFVTKLNPTGSSPLLYSTYLGGAGKDLGLGVAVDSGGAAYVTGLTSSGDFPTTAGAFDTTFGGVLDAFVTKLTFGAPATLTLAPTADTNEVSTQHCVTATVKDAAGDPTPGISVRFAVAGSVNTSGSATTNQNGEATFCYQGPELPGADAITAFADTDNDSTQDPGEPFGAAAKVWTLPVTTPLCQVSIDEGGTIIASNGDKATLSGNAQSDAAGNVKGQQEYRDHGPAQPQKVKSIQILALTCNPQRTQATIFGLARIDGQGSHLFRIDVEDLGEPGRGIDTYRILLDTGYDSGSHTLTGGNIQIR